MAAGVEGSVQGRLAWLASAKPLDPLFRRERGMSVTLTPDLGPNGGRPAAQAPLTPRPRGPPRPATPSVQERGERQAPYQPRGGRCGQRISSPWLVSVSRRRRLARANSENPKRKPKRAGDQSCPAGSTLVDWAQPGWVPPWRNGVGEGAIHGVRPNSLGEWRRPELGASWAAPPGTAATGRGWKAGHSRQLSASKVPSTGED